MRISDLRRIARRGSNSKLQEALQALIDVAYHKGIMDERAAQETKKEESDD